jgi:hypothetical protein
VELIKKLILDRLEDLIKIDAHCTSDLVQKYHKDKEEIVIKKLDSCPQL